MAIDVCDCPFYNSSSDKDGLSRRDWNSAYQTLFGLRRLEPPANSAGVGHGLVHQVVQAAVVFTERLARVDWKVGALRRWFLAGCVKICQYTDTPIVGAAVDCVRSLPFAFAG